MRHEWPQLLLWDKETQYPEKKLVPATKRSNLQGKTFFRKNYFGPHSFLMSFYFTKIFVRLPVIAAVCYFNVYKLIRLDPANIYLFTVNSWNTRKRHEILQKFTIESYSAVFTVKCFNCWLWIGKLLSKSSFLCKFITQSQHVFSIANFHKYLTTSSYSNDFMKKVIQPSCPNWKCCKLGSKNLFSFSLTFFHQLISHEGIFATVASLIFDFLHGLKLTATISSNLVLHLGMTPDCANAISKQGRLWRNPSAK